jgi:protoheme IX farnesyltransferase
MLPNVAGDAETRKQIVIYAAIMAAVGVLPAILGFAGIFYGVVSAVLGALFVAFSVGVWRNDRGSKAEAAAKRLFAFSVLYLFLLFAVLLVEGMGG